jgi:DNA polymerase I
MEAIRGDWSGLAREVQNQVLRMVLEDKSPVRAASYVAELARDLKGANIPLSSFVIWKSLTKRPEDYEVHAPHVEVAKKLTKAGWPVGSGDRVGYVVVKGPGKLYQRAEPHSKVSREDVDYDYYVDNQLLPVASRILGVLGVSEQEILAGRMNQAKL